MRLTPKQLEALRLVSEGQFFPTLVEEEDGWYARWRAPAAASSLSVDGWVDEYIREAAMTRMTEDAEDQRHETLHDAWLMALRSRTGRVVWDEAECRAFAAELDEWGGNAVIDVAARSDETFTLRFMSESEIELTASLPKGHAGYRALGQSVYVYPALASLRKRDNELVLSLTREEAEVFVNRFASELRRAGYTVRGLPDGASIELEAEFKEGDGPLFREKLTPMDLVVRVAGEIVSEAEIRFLLDQGSSLVFFRNRWIEVNRNLLKQALRALEKGGVRNAHLISFAMGLGHIGELEISSLKAHGWLRGLIHELQQAGKFVQGLAVPSFDGFVGELRSYQSEGVAWMRFLLDHGFGALLADDMGLGKTIQTIALISSFRPTRPFLIVAPLTLLTNWKREIAAFAPRLRTYVHAGESRHFASGFRYAAQQVDVVITSYNLLVRDYTSFSEIEWEGLVLDEAQIIKNPQTKVAEAVKALSPAKRIALTGTPIENSVRDLWSIEDFLNPGFLGDRQSFEERFAKPLRLDRDSSAARRLKHAMEPFMLRRLKTDERIAAELGEKREIREFCQLGAATRRAYEAALSTFRASPRSPGDALALLTELKLICDGIVESGSERLETDESGKLARLELLVESIFESGESVLVFTQYAKVGAALQRHLGEKFKRRIPFLHGALTPRARENEIRLFNLPHPEAFILSLKAGGYGLNLTKATHIIHYDRWWNPAVENQATDRAYRIGQSKDVFVHLMMCEGTIEERIDDILLKKTSLKTLLSDGEAFWKAVALT